MHSNIRKNQPPHESRTSAPSEMLSPLVSWILQSSSSSSSSSGGEENYVTDDGDHYENVGENEHFPSETEEFPSTSCANDNIPTPFAVPVADASPSVTAAVPVADDSSVPNNIDASPRKRQRVNNSNSRRQYQRLWTKQDEIELLRGYLDYIKQHGWATTSLQNDVAFFYDHVRLKLNKGFDKNQIVQKLRGLKRKHKNALDRINSGRGVPYKSPQEEVIFDISQRIWGKNRDQESSPEPDTNNLCDNDAKYEEDDGDEMENTAVRRRKRSQSTINDSGHLNDEKKGIQGLIEETMRSCLSPILKEVLNNAVEGSPLRLVEQYGSGEVGDEKWRKQRILELEAYLKQLELLQDQIKARIKELQTNGD